MKIPVSIILLYFCGIIQLKAQQYKELPLFHPALLSPSFIHSNNISRINLNVAFKLDNSRIKSKGIDYQYEYDESGNLIKETKVVQLPTGITDTNVTDLYYYSNNLLKVKRTRVNKQYFAYYYEYDSLSRITKEVYTEDIPLPNNDNFIIDKQIIKALETYSYQNPTPVQEKMIFHNDEGKPYKTCIRYFDETKRLIEENYQFSYTNIRTNIKYKYGPGNKLQEQTVYSDAGKAFTETIIWLYNAEGKLESSQKLKDNTLTEQSYYFYSEATRLPEATITKILADESMILKDFKITKR